MLRMYYTVVVNSVPIQEIYTIRCVFRNVQEMHRLEVLITNVIRVIREQESPSRI